VEGTSPLGRGVRNSRLNQRETTGEVDLTMKNLWLAAVLGIIVGIALASGPSPVTTQAEDEIPQLMASQREAVKAAPPTQGSVSLQSTMLALFVGVLMGTPFFLVAKKRSG